MSLKCSGGIFISVWDHPHPSLTLPHKKQTRNICCACEPHISSYCTLNHWQSTCPVPSPPPPPLSPFATHRDFAREIRLANSVTTESLSVAEHNGSFGSTAQAPFALPIDLVFTSLNPSTHKYQPTLKIYYTPIWLELHFQSTTRTSLIGTPEPAHCHSLQATAVDIDIRISLASSGVTVKSSLLYLGRQVSDSSGVLQETVP